MFGTKIKFEYLFYKIIMCLLSNPNRQRFKNVVENNSIITKIID